MAHVAYVFRRIWRMDINNMLRKLGGLHQKSGRSYPSLLVDMWRCAVRYGAGYTDYELFELYRLTAEQRDTYLTRGRNNELMKRYNDPAFAVLFDNKIRFDERFAGYLAREFIHTGTAEETAVGFLERHGMVILKPADGMCGKGVQVWSVKEHGGARMAWTELCEAGVPMVIEQRLEQHPALSAVYPHAINTVRVVTIVDGSAVHIPCAYWRIGNNGAAVDNFNSGGMVAPIDVVSGIVTDHAADKQKRVYERHPYTEKPVKGVVLPFWEEARALVTAAAQEVPQMRYIGWDVAFTPQGVCLVEGNNFPGHDIYQLPPHTPDGVGVWAKFQV